MTERTTQTEPAGGDRVERLQHAALALAAAEDFAGVARVTTEHVAAALGGDGGFLVVLTPDGESLEMAASSGVPEDLAAAWRRFALNADLPLAEAVRTGEPRWPQTVAERTARYSHLAGQYAASGAESWLSLPLAVRDRPIGGLSIRFAAGRRFAADDRPLALALASLSATTLDRARLRERERRAAAASQFLAEASALLGGSLEYEATLAAVARAAVPTIADWCAVDLVGQAAEGGPGAPGVRRLAVAHVDPQKVALAHELQRRWPARADAPQGVPNVLRTGRPELATEIPDDLLRRVARDEEHLAVLRSLGLRSYMIAPLRVAGSTTGAITFASAESGRRFGPDDLQLAERLAERAALAIEHARLYREAEERTREQMLLNTALRETAEARDRALEGERAARAQAEAERGLLRSVIQQAPAMIAITRGPRHVFEAANPLFMQTVGIRNILGRGVREALPELEGQGYFELLDRVYATGEAFRGSELLVRLDRNGDGRFDPDEEGYFTFVYQPYRGADRQVAGIFVHAVEVTEHVRARDEALRRGRQAALGAAVGAALTETRAPREMLQRCAEALVRHLDAAFARVWTLDEAEQVLELQASAGMYTHLDGPHGRVPVGHLKIGQIAQERRPHLTNSVVGDPRVGDQEWARREGMVAFAGYPLLIEDRVVGVMALFARHALSEDTLEALGSVARMVATGIERKRAEAALEHQLGVTRTITENAASCLFMMDARGHPTFMNPAAERVTGYVLEEIRHEPLHYAVHHTYPDGRPYPIEECPIDSAAAELAPTHDQEETFVRRDGTLFPVRYSVAPLRRAGRTVGAVLEFRDVTREKAAEAALREETETLETVNRLGRIIAAELDQEALAQAVTDAATELTGAQFGAFFYNVVDDAGESLVLYALSGAPREAFAQFPIPRNTKVFDPTFRGEGVVRVDDITRDPRYGQNPPYGGMPPGHLPVVSYLAVPVVSRSGEVLGGLFFGHPQPGVFTARHERIVAGLAAQAAVSMDNARLYRQAQQAVRVRDDFLAAASHDLKNPLAAISGTVQVLQRTRARRGAVPDERLEPALEAISTAAQQMARQIDELLDVARLRLGQGLVLDRRPTDLAALARRAVEAFRQTTERHRLRLDVRGAGEDGRIVGEWDAARLERVVDNLLANAIKYSPGGGEVAVTATCEGDEAVLSVMDQGLGIPKAEVPHIFERFRRASNVAGRIGGSGIGLAAAQLIVGEHGGSIAVESEEGRGSTFTVRLPLRPPRPAAQESPGR